MTWLVLGGAAVLLYVGWGVLERRRHARAHEVAAELESFGDELVPTSIHPTIDTGRCMGSGACIAACPEDHVLGMVDGQARLINPLACIGHGACMAACPVDAITLVFGTAKRGVELPVVDPHFQTSQAGVYVVGELGGMGLIRNAVEQGRQAAAHVAAGARRGAGDVLDAIVVGAGPAGMGAGLELQRLGLRAELLDEAELGGAIQHYPRGKVTMTGALALPGRAKIRGKTMTKEQLIALWHEARADAALVVHANERATGLRRDGDAAWVVATSAGERRAASVILALGRRGAPKKLGAPGEELAKVSYRLLEPEAFAGQRVLVVGGGNAAADCAIALVERGRCAQVALSYRRPELARLRAQVRSQVEALIRTGRLRAILPSEVVAIAETTVTLEHPGGRREELGNDAVIVQIGGTSPAALLATFGIETVERRGS